MFLRGEKNSLSTQPKHLCSRMMIFGEITSIGLTGEESENLEIRVQALPVLPVEATTLGENCMHYAGGRKLAKSPPWIKA